jgi:YbbR domain-containing protein
VEVLSFLIGKLQAIKTRWKALVFCLFAAVIFWFLSALNKEHTTVLALPITLSFDQERFIPIKPLPQKLLVNVTGNGWDLLLKSLGYQTAPIEINLERPDLTPYILASSLRNELAISAGKLNINFIVSDTLRTAIDKRVSKKLKLDINPAGLSFSQGYGFHDKPLASPDTVSVNGPATLVDSLSGVLILNPVKKRIAENVTFDVPVKIDAGLVIQPSKVMVVVKSGLVETRSIRIPLVLSKKRSLTKIKSDSVNIILRGPKTFLDSLRFSGVQAYITSAENGRRDFIKPQVSGLPIWVNLIEVDSVRVK